VKQPRTLRTVDVTPLKLEQLTPDERAILVNGIADILLDWAIAEVEREDRERERQRSATVVSAAPPPIALEP
jgi:hypothetical protein